MGGDIWSAKAIKVKKDNFHYTYLPASGDIVMKIRVQSFTGTTSHIAGLMMRATLHSQSTRYLAMSSPVVTIAINAGDSENSYESQDGISYEPDSAYIRYEHNHFLFLLKDILTDFDPFY